jgi:hypothetical protein
MVTQLEFSSTDDLFLAARAGIDEDFLNRINQTVAGMRNFKRAQPSIGKMTAHLTSPDGDDFQITLN